jgi:hypothetical protein
VGSRDVRGLHSIGQNQIPRQTAFLDSDKCTLSCRFQRVQTGSVRIANEQMKSPIFSVIRQRLIACVNDRAIELHPLIDVVDDVIGTLTELKINLSLCLWRLKIECERV